jgi:hypothetical protein
MRNKFKLLGALVTLMCFVACKKNNCRSATLYYTPSCATIKGYVIFDDNEEGRVFLDEIDSRYRQTDGVKVCIEYDELGAKILTADCFTYKVIKIKSIE